MDDFIIFLKSSKSFLKSLPSQLKNIHITLGNESCDLDSSISSLIWAYFLSKLNPTTKVIPVLNVTQDNFKLRTENCFVLKEAGIQLDNLVFRNDVNLKEILSKGSLSVTLVDHHILSKNDEPLVSYVMEIFDHRPVDKSFEWDNKNVKIRIEQVGSCCTLIADEIIKLDDEFLSGPLAYLLYQTIIYDTIALKPENGKAKPLDIEVGRKLEQSFNFKNEDRQALFDRLWAAHNDVSHLTSTQLLYKDLKIVEQLYIPGLPMLVEDFLKRKEAFEAVVAFADEHKVACILLVGLDASGGTVRRDIAIYSKTTEDKLREALIKTFTRSKEYNFQFEKRNTQFNEHIELLHMHNTKLSRKQLVPLVKQALKCFNCDE